MKTGLVVIGASLTLLTSGCAKQDRANRPSVSEPNSAQRLAEPSPAQEETAAQQSVKGFSVRVVSVKRAKDWEDPRFKKADFGPAGGPRLESQKAGFEFAVIEVDVKRLVDNARFELKEMWILDSSGKKYKSPILFQDPLGESAAETREFVFPVPIKSELKRIQLAAQTFIELP